MLPSVGWGVGGIENWVAISNWYCLNEKPSLLFSTHFSSRSAVHLPERRKKALRGKFTLMQRVSYQVIYFFLDELTLQVIT